MRANLRRLSRARPRTTTSGTSRILPPCRQPPIELDVLVPHHFFVERAHAAEHLAAVTAKGNGVDPSGLRRADPIVGVADAEGMRDRHGDGLRHRALAAGAHD